MEIDLGTNIDVSWTRFIALRHSAGDRWTTINTDGLTVLPRYVDPLVVPSSDPLRRGQKEKFMISLLSPSGYEVYSFDMSTVTNQAGWTQDMPGLMQCVNDITTWISLASGSAVVFSGSATIVPSSSASVAWSLYRTTSLINVGQIIKASPGNLGGWNIINLTNAIRYVKFVDKAAGVVVGTDPVIATIKVPALGSFYQEGNSVQYGFSAGIAMYCVTGAGDSNTVSPAANTVIVDIKYK